jgi:hypothetical protein
MKTADERAYDARLSEAAGTNATLAIKHLARAAALEEQINDGSHSEGQLWFLVRAMCNEHGRSVEMVTDSARRYAQGVIENRINVT